MTMVTSFKLPPGFGSMSTINNNINQSCTADQRASLDEKSYTSNYNTSVLNSNVASGPWQSELCSSLAEKITPQKIFIQDEESSQKWTNERFSEYQTAHMNQGKKTPTILSSSGSIMPKSKIVF